MQINELVDKAFQNAKDKGFEDKPSSFLERIALVHSELSEAVEAYRKLDNDAYDSIRKPLYRSAVTGNLTSFKDEFRFVDDADILVPNKPEGVVSELADAVIRIAHICGVYGIDLDAAIQEKMKFNRTRGYKHGKLC